MDLDELLISTGVDQMIKLLKERGRMELGEVARQLKLQPQTVEDWAHALEEEGLISVEYRLTRVYLVWKQPSPNYVAKKEYEAKSKAAQAKESAQRLLAKVQEGKGEIERIQEEVERLKQAVYTGPQEIERLRTEILELNKKYKQIAASGNSKLQQLQQKIEEFGKKSQLLAPKGQQSKLDELLAILQKQEEAINEQLETANQVFEAFEQKTAQLKEKLAGIDYDKDMMQIKARLEDLAAIKQELDGAIEAIIEEQRQLEKDIKELQEKLERWTENDQIALKKQLAELARMEKDAQRQKEAVCAMLDESLIALKKQQQKIAILAEKQKEAEEAMQKFKEEYVDIAEEISREKEGLLAKQKEIEKMMEIELGALESAGSFTINEKEINKAELMISELKRQQAELEKSTKAILKELEIFKQSETREQADAAPWQQQEAEASNLVQRIKLSSEEEAEIERKRQELRALIQKIWTESKSGRE
ncbi:MAG: hypothetical protein QXT25_01760 [Candidatus Anstonellaceae archaeon]